MALLSQPPPSWTAGSPPKRSSRFASMSNKERRSVSPGASASDAKIHGTRPVSGTRDRAWKSGRLERSSQSSLGSASKEVRQAGRGPLGSKTSPSFLPPEDDGGTGGAGSRNAMGNAPAVQSSLRQSRQSSSPLSQEARDWLEENADRLAVQTQKCLLIHQQLHELLFQGSPLRRMDAPPARDGKEASSLSVHLEGAPLDLAGKVSQAAAQRRDELKSELAAADQKKERLQQQSRIQEEKGKSFEKALEDGSEAEMRRLREQASVLEARLRDRLDAVEQLASQASAPKWSPFVWSPSSPGAAGQSHSPFGSYHSFDPKARSMSPPRQQRATSMTIGKPPMTRRTLSGSPRAVSGPVVVARSPLIRVAAAAAAGVARPQAATLAHPLQQLDDARQRAQADFWSGTM